MCLTLAGGPAKAAPPGQETCLPALAAVERAGTIPRALLHAIAIAESGRLDPITKVAVPWAWTVTANGAGRSFPNKATAIEATQALLAAGTTSVDVGCMQVNLAYHPQAFASLEQAFDPNSNVAYASRFLGSLFAKTRTWSKAVAAYHSQTPALGTDYERRVMAQWPLASDFVDPPVGKERPGRLAADRQPGFSAWASRNDCDKTRVGSDHVPAAQLHRAAATPICTPSRSPPPCFICQGVDPPR